MPFSWMKVSNGTSRKVRNCMGNDHSKASFQKCVEKIVKADGGSVDQVYFEVNGLFAHVHVRWNTLAQKANIVFDLEAVEVTDLLTAQEADNIARKRGGA